MDPSKVTRRIQPRDPQPTAHDDGRQHRILVVADPERMAGPLRQTLQEHNYEVVTAGDARAALGILGQGKPFHLILVGILSPAEAGFIAEQEGFRFLGRLKRGRSGVPVAVLTESDVETCIVPAAEHDVGNLLSASIDRDDFLDLVRRWVSGRGIFGLANHLPDAEIEVLQITHTDEIMSTIDTIQEAFGRKAAATDLHLRLAIEEMITNAVYHGNALPKHTLHTALTPKQYVRIEYGCSAEAMGAAISDQGGRLTRRDVMQAMHNCVATKLTTTGGRGWFLTRGLIDRLVINVSPGNRTEMVLVQHFDRRWKDRPKPLLINEV